MQGLRLFLLCVVVCVQVQHSLAFKDCNDNTDCPDNAKCLTDKCGCDAGFEEIDLPYTSNSGAVTVCRGTLWAIDMISSEGS